jgi:hypothetical protein
VLKAASYRPGISLKLSNLVPVRVSLLMNDCAMTVEKVPFKPAVSVSEMAEMCALSRSRFYSLVIEGVFPQAIKFKSSKRPIYDQKLQQKCLDIRRTCIGLNGQPLLFNRRANKERAVKAAKPEHADLLEALNELGLKTTSIIVAESLKRAFPKGINGQDQGIVIRKLFQDIKRHERKPR